jgi:transposase InsO family protein
MPYTTNPHQPKLRMHAVYLVKQKGWSARKVCRYLGVGSGTVTKWLRRDYGYGFRPIPTRSSRPHHHPQVLKPNIVDAIIHIRLKRRRCAEVVHQELRNEGIHVSLSSVKRTLERQHLLRKRSPWKRYHAPETRPLAEKPGDLVEIDTIHVVPRLGERFYVYTLLDVKSRWAWAKTSSRINTHRTLQFVRDAQKKAPFRFRTLQSDHGSEFSTWFTEHVRIRGYAHRHSRVRRPNDNGHLERFNRTIQDECLRKLPERPEVFQKAVRKYLPYYNAERLHLGLNLKTPLQCVQAID